MWQRPKQTTFLNCIRQRNLTFRVQESANSQSESCGLPFKLTTFKMNERKKTRIVAYIRHFLLIYIYLTTSTYCLQEKEKKNYFLCTFFFFLFRYIFYFSISGRTNLKYRSMYVCCGKHRGRCWKERRWAEEEKTVEKELKILSI